MSPPVHKLAKVTRIKGGSRHAFKRRLPTIKYAKFVKGVIRHGTKRRTRSIEAFGYQTECDMRAKGRA
jgi:hypothetical protein